MTSSLRLGPAALTLLLVAAGCATSAPPLPDLEAAFTGLRELHDAIDVAEARGLDRGEDGRALPLLRREYAEARAALTERLANAAPAGRPGAADAAAFGAMRAALASVLPVEATAATAREAAGAPDCALASVNAAGGDLAALQARVYACYGRAAQNVRFDDETLDRLTVFARLAQTDDREARRRLFLALDPVWRSVNGDDGAQSPFRRLVALSSARWAKDGSPVERNARALGVEPAQVEPWLVSILEAWRDATPNEPIEPWDWHYRAGALSRALRDQVPADRLRAVHDAFYRSLGADPAALPIRYDLAPRAGKTPVAFTTFGRRPRLGEHGAVIPGEAWIFATYRAGGIDNLVELLHETGHAVHILAIRTRPAYADWPDSDTFTEALGDLVALEAYEPAWQQRWLGASGTLADSLRAKYASIVLDVAWALFEVRMHRAPASDPNQVWSAITHDYLHVVPHPELSWWAMRGQLVDSPGYMMNYALGAIVVADLRARCRELRGPFANPDPGMYDWLGERLYRFGLERTSRAVVEDFLGRPVSPAALLADLGRMSAGR